jgi:hypothetical protein
MKLPESIIDKYQLRPTYEQVGRSFFNNLEIFISDHKLLLDNWRVMECDLNGEPSPYITFYDKGTKKHYQCTIEFIESMDVEQILAAFVNMTA